MCGNYRKKWKNTIPNTGSPPRVRELLPCRHSISFFLRITPACAGITEMSKLTSGVCGDHPRVCGNYQSAGAPPGRPGGSPPRVRELHQEQSGQDSVSGITPACAGITSMKSLSKASISDHPRVCGNYIACIFLCNFIRGSPPRVRELLTFAIVIINVVRITPACAGIT